MRTVKLLSWRAENVARATSIAQHDIVIDSRPLVRNSAVVGELARLNPAALVLDLDKLPSKSREIALMLRASKSACRIPILFAGSLPADGSDRLPEKYDRLRRELPDIPYSTWADAPRALRLLLENPPTAPPVVPAPRAYTASLAEKLGIVSTIRNSDKQQAVNVALLAAPDEFLPLLGDLPENVTLSARITPATALTICFIRTLADLPATIDLLVFRMPAGTSAWIAYPKRAANPHLEFNENTVRALALAAGLVDYKICSIDAAWSATKFARRKLNKP